jgi:hypothetical protein
LDQVPGLRNWLEVRPIADPTKPWIWNRLIRRLHPR